MRYKKSPISLSLLVIFLMIGQIWAAPVSSIDGGTVITFDTPDTDSISDLTAFGITVNSLETGGIPFVDGPGSSVGVGNLPSQAFSNNLVGIFNGPSNPPNFPELTVRSFEVVFANPVSAVGFSVQGWGSNDHAVQAFDSAGNSIEFVNFSQLLNIGDSSVNGFIGVDGEGTLIKRFAFQAQRIQPDAVAFDNLTFVPSAIPEPRSIILLIFALIALIYKKNF